MSKRKFYFFIFLFVFFLGNNGAAKDNYFDEGKKLFDQTVKSWIPLQREQTPEDIGNAVAFLASDIAQNITGQSINVDGGRFTN